MNISKDQVYQLNNNMGSTARKLQLGTLIQSLFLAIADLAKKASGEVQAASVSEKSIDVAHLSEKLVPSHVTKAAGSFRTAGGAAEATIAIQGGVGETDIVSVTVLDRLEGSNVSIKRIVPGQDGLRIEFSEDPGPGFLLHYEVKKPV